jgi:putative transposase
VSGRPSDATAGIALREPADPSALPLDFLPFEERAVRRDGVRLFNVLYQDGALAHLVDGGGARLRVKYDPRDLSAVYVELPAGEHVRVPYADLGRPAVTLWEHRLAAKRLRAEGWRTVDEHAIFAAVEEQRRVLADACGRSRTVRRAVARIDLAAGSAAGSVVSSGKGRGTEGQDAEARVQMPRDGETSGVEFW